MTLDSTGRENFKTFLSTANDILLKVEYLTADDRETIQRGKSYLLQGYSLIEHEDDSTSLREAAWLFLLGAYILGSRCIAADSEEEFWRRKRCSAGGGKEDAPQRRRKKWEGYLRECLAKNPNVSVAILVDSLLLEKEAPKCMPASREYLLKRARKIKKDGADKRDDVLRLVHGGKA